MNRAPGAGPLDPSGRHTRPEGPFALSPWGMARPLAALPGPATLAEFITIRASVAAFATLLILAGASCGRATTGEDAKVTTLGSIEVTARLLEVPKGAIFQRDLYHYATVLEYEVLRVHRGRVDGPRILVGHYDPWKPRWEAADDRVPGIGGDLSAFRAGDVHRMALEPSIDDHYMGAIVNQYFEKRTGSVHWVLWTNRASE